MQKQTTPAPGFPPPVAAADAELMAGVLRGDRAALAALYDRHAGRVLALATALVKDAEVAHALVHEVFLRAWHLARDFDPARATVLSWLVSRLLDAVKAACTGAQRTEAARTIRAMTAWSVTTMPGPLFPPTGARS